jgi:hypothetical protein
MRTFIRLTFLLFLIIVGIDLAGLLWSGDDPSPAFKTATAEPPASIKHAENIGYYHLLGFVAAPSADPIRTGFDMWAEAEIEHGKRYLDYTKESRAALRLSSDEIPSFEAWEQLEPITYFHQQRKELEAFWSDHPHLLNRYEQWLNMPFDDLGYGIPGSPRFLEIFVAHRIFLAHGFAGEPLTGLERLEKDLNAWRVVFDRAKTLPLKLVATSVIDDDAKLLSDLLSYTKVDRTVIMRARKLARPLTQPERSLRWAMRHEFITGLWRYERATFKQKSTVRVDAEDSKGWTAMNAGVSVEELRSVEHPVPRNPLARVLIEKQRNLNILASYYEALAEAAERADDPLPRLHDIVKAAPRNLFDSLLDPFDNVLYRASEPDWKPFLIRMTETDARLRLAALQVIIREEHNPSPVQVHVTKAGTEYYDPFSGYPMEWNPELGLLYSVGKDGREDGGEPGFDISVRVPQPHKLRHLAPAKPVSKSKRPARRT